MPYAIGDRVVVLDTEDNRRADVAGRSGVVTGLAYEDETPDVHEGYAVTLDGDLTTMVAVDGLRPE